ncbi:MAG TPA: lipid-A-disaccharide synthase [Phnomibacter sp.]|nr:lipid-A-disaccharide synthase [Phnomibacter sp.]
MKYYIIAGEASGDLHASNLIKYIKYNDPKAELRGWGGDKMEAEGTTLVKHFRDLAFMGFAEVVMNLKTILSNIKFCKQDILQNRPDALILVDYPGFNLRIAKWAKANGLKVIYYISPQVWAWKENRVKMMRQCIDLMMVILPFEKKYYKEKWNWDVEYVGHPLVQVINDFTPTITHFSDKPVVAVLPGSRKQEIAVKLPVMLEVSLQFPHLHFIVAMAPGMDENFYKQFTDKYPNASCVGGLTYDLLKTSTAAMVTSGTATLETAIFRVPEVVCYKGNAISYQIAKRLITIKYISLVNLIMDKPIVKELIQDEMNSKNLATELKDLLDNPVRQQTLSEDYKSLHELLSAGGNASQKAAQLIQDFLQGK